MNINSKIVSDSLFNPKEVGSRLYKQLSTVNSQLSTMIAFFLFTLFGCKSTDVVQPVAATLPTMSIENLTLFEGNDKTTFPFKLTLSKATDKDVTVQFATKDNTAVAGIDYVAKSGTLTIPANSTQGTIEIIVIGDTIKQADKLFSVVLSNPNNATLTNVEAVGTIRNDDTYIFIPNDGYTTPEAYAGYSKLWNDEFNGKVLDQTIWTPETGGSGWGNNELEYYTDRLDNTANANAFISSGNLIIEARKEDFIGKNYTSARLSTQRKKDFTFGRMDIRAKLPKGKGIWPALWMLGKKIESTNWPNCGEIDIMELIGSAPKDIHATVHYGPIGASSSTSKTSTYSLTPSGDFSDKFHVYTLLWTQDKMEFLIDDYSYFSTTKSAIGDIYPFNEPFFTIFNVAVGGNWPGSPDATTVFPQRMIVDYVRVFQKQ